MSDNVQAHCFHRFTISAIVAALQNMQGVLAKAEAHSRQNKRDFATLLQASLYPDMYNLLQQLQYACYIPADFAQHFSDDPAPRVGYDETSLAEVRASIDATIGYLTAIPPRRLAERASRVVPTFMDSEQGMPAQDYAAAVTMPDFYFHVAVAYAILRHNGVPLGKSDFLGDLQMVPMVPVRA